jgi:IclR family transcriptional regulator, acetate operon repressor
LSKSRIGAATEGHVLQSVTTALGVFEMVARHQPIGLSELSRRTGVNKSTVQRCLQTLSDQGWLRTEDEQSAKWVITARILEVGRQVKDGNSLSQAALPTMMRLRDATQENVHLAVAEVYDSVLLERLESPHPIRIFYAIGSRVPLNAAAAGKAMLAYWDPEALSSFIAAGLRRMTDSTIIDANRLRKELVEIRKRGWASTVNELDDGASAVAAPILNHSGKPIGAVSVSAPSSRMTNAKRLSYAELVVQSAFEISRAL